jgi:RNA-splicing ligase RtcB
MIEYQGEHAKALCFTDTTDPTTVQQMYKFLNHPAFAASHIAIMPDAHAGKGCMVGFTMKLNNYVIPNVVGVDIGCGVLGICLGDLVLGNHDFERFHEFIEANIPTGFSVRTRPHQNAHVMAGEVEMVARETQKMLGMDDPVIDIERATLSLGTLGGGNHFIELDIDERCGAVWLLIHSGSRKFGLETAEAHQRRAKELMRTMFIGAAYRDLEFLPMDLGGFCYMRHMRRAQKYARINRMIIAKELVKFFGFELNHLEQVESTHNYIGEDRITRKGAVSAQEGERLLIPLNMEDGTLLCTGLGNPAWNYSAPHGAGRQLSRKRAKETLTMEAFKAGMRAKQVWSASVDESTLDECKAAYKPPEEILGVIHETVVVDAHLRSVFNYKDHKGAEHAAERAAAPQGDPAKAAPPAA